ncbi:hypothetical protein CWI84_02180 [Idiomarina tyrosinivorans]|uniref:Wadjet protein JetD C-terminal domain-containing protein n=1 Tax=Idiomarina tyrosinivorans TaxID=1445662 RepID=A0A432ZSV1_9GAMM|nr:Wadjet anti-phage system protein JetD domain-containing protein [Idiomarina tyrosinivorans]RUO80942.1 hypothetical protein CWI84_02180 [Idiomarina tyrosinivorans]
MFDRFLQRVINQVNLPSQLIQITTINFTAVRFDFYFKAPLSVRLKFHDELEALRTTTGALSLLYAAKTFNEEPKLKAVHITDSRRLLNALNVAIRADLVRKSTSLIEETNQNRVTWLSDIISEVTAGWHRGKKPYSIGPEDVQKLRDAFVFIDWYEQKEADKVDIDTRTLSAQLYGPTKRLEEIMGTIASIYKGRLYEEVAECKPSEILSYLGVSRFPPQIRVKGPVVFYQKNGGVLDISASWPSASCPPDVVEKVSLSGEPNYVLFIENRTTFERYTREINDKGLVLYTNGFPSRTWLRIFKCLDELLPSHVPFYHWGDVDEGGFKILAFLDKLLSRELTPHCMVPSTIKTYEAQKVLKLKNLLTILAQSDSDQINGLRQTIEDLLKSGDYCYWVEQEHLPIISCQPLNESD